MKSHQIYQCLRRLPNGTKVRGSISRIIEAYTKDDDPWIVGYSGGKDSSAVLKLIFQALLRIGDPHKDVIVIYCDTGVEIPIAVALVHVTLADLEVEAREFDLPIRTKILSPPIKDRFFVRVIGRGYPPPTDKFRWCTDRLRIGPVTRFLRSEQFGGATVVLGVREAESAARRLTLRENRTTDPFWRRQRGHAGRRLFMPIIDYSTHDVWHVNLLVDLPRAVRGKEVADLYVSASGECPTIREVKGAPCGKARFGCWTCTVAKHGVTMRNLIDSGESRLAPLLQYRLWLERERNNVRYRWPRRRNGQVGLGPMTLEWRRIALEKLLEAERASGFRLVTDEEIQAIKREWEADGLQHPEKVAVHSSLLHRDRLPTALVPTDLL